MKKLLALTALLTLFSLTAHAAPAAGPWAPFDTDGNGEVTHEEFMDRAERRFKELDEDGDKVLTKAEFEAHMRRGMQGRSNKNSE